MLKAGITFNLRKNIPSDLPDAEAEFDDMDTILAIQSAVEAAGFESALYEATEDLPIRLMQKKPDIVFNIAEGITGRGREAQVPAILNFLGIPFAGSDETAMCVAMDKELTKRLAASYGINAPKCQLVRYGAPMPEIDLPFPVIVKPNAEGSSKGITDLSIAHDADNLRRVLSEKISSYKVDMLVEEYISGREFTVGVLGNGDTLRIFSPMEILFNDKTHGIYSREVKKNFGQYVSYKCPAETKAETGKEIEDTVKTVYRALGCRDFARLDFMLSPNGRLYFLEINPLPGLAPGYSDFPMIAEFCGMDYNTLIRNILDSALTRYGLHHKERDKRHE